MEQQIDENAVEKEKQVETPVDRVSEIAQEALADIKAKEQNPESKDAGTDSSSEKEKVKDQKDEESDVEKIKAATQKRIDELTSDVYSERQKRDEDSKLITVLEQEIRDLRASLEKSGTIKTEKATTEDAVRSSWAAYETEDAAKPYAERREMSREELETFLVEDAVAAQEWMIERRLRRERELQEAVDKKEEEKKNNKESLSQKEFVETQNRAKGRLISKYPDLDISKSVLDVAKEIFSETEFAIFTAKDADLSSDDLKTKQSLMESGRSKIIERIRKDNRTYDEMMKIIESDEKKYVESANGPELVMLELDKRLRKTYSEEDLQKAREEAAKKEKDRQANIDTSNPPSGPIGSHSMKSDFQKSPRYKEGLSKFLEAARRSNKNWTEQDYIKILERRKNIPGANLMDEADAKAAGRAK